MLGQFLQPNAVATIAAMDLPDDIKRHCAEVIFKGYTVIRGAVPAEECARLIADFHAFEDSNAAIFSENRDAHGHYPRIVNLHTAYPRLLHLFTRNSKHLAVSDALFGGRTALYTSLFYETGSQQPIHRDTPVFCTRPEYLYFGNTVYLEEAGDENGCLEVIEGGHLVGELHREDMARAHYGSLDEVRPDDGELWIKYQDTVVERCHKRGLTKTKVYVQPGDSLIWHPQLPHGGSPIADKSRTRFSLVIHSTPEGVPVYHQDAFFRPGVAYSETAPWTYYEFEGRKIANGQGISFGHQKAYPVSAFRPVAA
jgi:ectoine hydroxylase-related dioxygenase (phytanoyl-CoA dioxygenase family)